jgi:hypothetical protein
VSVVRDGYDKVGSKEDVETFFKAVFFFLMLMEMIINNPLISL